MVAVSGSSVLEVLVTLMGVVGESMGRDGSGTEWRVIEGSEGIVWWVCGGSGDCFSPSQQQSMDVESCEWRMDAIQQLNVK